MAAVRRTVSYSEIDTFRQCPLKHRLGYKERWVAPGGGGSVASDRGTCFHAVLEAHYNVIKAIQTELFGDNPARMSDAQWAKALKLARINAESAIALTGEHAELMQWMYDGYMDANRFADRSWWVVEVEDKREIVLPNPTGARSKFNLKVKIDLLIRDLAAPGYPYRVVDHKSGGNLPTDREMDLDDQFPLYEIAMRLSGIKVVGTIYNAMRTTRNQADFPDYVGKSKPQTLADRHKRNRRLSSGAELVAIATDAYNAVSVAYSVQTEKLPFSSPDPRQCGWKCDYSDQHIAARKIGVPVEEALARVGFKQNFERH